MLFLRIRSSLIFFPLQISLGIVSSYFVPFNIGPKTFDGITVSIPLVRRDSSLSEPLKVPFFLPRECD